MEVSYYLGILEFLEGRYPEASECCQRILDWPSEIVAPIRRGSVISVQNVRARSLELLGFMCGIRDDYLGLLHTMFAAARENDQSPRLDAYLSGSLLRNLSAAARYVHGDEVLPYLRQASETCVWPAQIPFMRFFVKSTIGLLETLGGEFAQAQRTFEDCRDVSYEAASELIAVVNLIELDLEMDESIDNGSRLRQIIVAAQAINWETVYHEQRSDLMRIAVAVSRHDAFVARRLFDRYLSLRAPMDFFSIANRDRRMRADTCFALGRILRAQDQPNAAVVHFTEAFAIENERGMDRMAAEAAIEIAELSGVQRYWEYAAAVASKYPLSRLARRVQQFELRAG